MNKNERWIVLLMGSSHTMVHLYEQIFPALLLTMVVHFQIQISTAGWMQTFLALAFGLGALPAGYIADRIGSKRIIMVYLLGAACSCIFIAFARSATMLAVGLTALGASISLYHPAGTTLITTQVNQIGKALGYHGMGGGLGLAFAPLLATLLAAVSPTYGWRLSFLGFGLLGLLVAMGVGTLEVSEVKVSNPRGRFLPERLASGSVTRLALFLLVGVLVGFCYRGVTTYLPTYFSQNLNGGFLQGQDLLKGGTFATITLLVGVVGQFIGGHLTSRFKLEHLFAALMLMTVPMLVLMSFLVDFPLIFIAMTFALFHFSSQPVGNNLIAEYTDPRGRGLGYGLYFSLAFGVGSFASGFSGMIAERFGLNMVFSALAVVIFIGFFVMVYLAKRGGEDRIRLDAETA